METPSINLEKLNNEWLLIKQSVKRQGEKTTWICNNNNIRFESRRTLRNVLEWRLNARIHVNESHGKFWSCIAIGKSK